MPFCIDGYINLSEADMLYVKHQGVVVINANTFDLPH